MKTQYAYLLKSIIDYLNNNSEDNYYFVEIQKDENVRFGIITKENPVSDLTIQYLNQLIYATTYIKQNEAKEYLDNNNVICCYYIEEEKYWNCSPEEDIDLKQSYYYVRCIDRELLNNVLMSMNDSSMKLSLKK